VLKKKNRGIPTVMVKRTLSKLLEDLDNSLKYLSRSFSIQGYDAKDLYQIMAINIIKTYQKDVAYYSNRTLGFWFMRSRWALLNMEKDNSKRNPIANSISINSFLDSEGTS